LSALNVLHRLIQNDWNREVCSSGYKNSTAGLLSPCPLQTEHQTYAISSIGLIRLYV